MDKNYLVTKSNYFIMNSSYDLSLQEQRIILTLSGMVQPTDEEFKPYIFKISEFMKIIGVEDKSKYTEIPRITKELMKKVFEIEEGKKVIQVAWLSSAVYEKGTGYVELEFSPRLKPYMLKLNTMFTQYKLTNVLSMKSKYSIRLYEILKCNEFKKQGYIEIEISDLRKLVKAEDVYPLYANFKQKLLMVTQKEINLNTDISFEFEEIKTVRKITSLRFIIKANKANIQPLDEMCATRVEKLTTEEENHIMVYTKTVQAIFREKITEKDAKALLTYARGNVNLIKEKYDLPRKSDIGNVVGWVRDAIKDDYKASKGKTNYAGAFNDYEQRKYDFGKLEDKLLGKDKDNKTTGEDSMSWEEQLLEYKKTKHSETPTAI